MIRGDLTPAVRRKALAVAFAFAAGGCFAIWLGLSGVLPFARSLSARAPLVAFRPTDLMPLPLAVSLFAFAAMCLIPMPRDEGRSRKHRAGAARTWRAATVLLGIAAGGVVLGVVAAPIGRAVVTSAVAERGYAPCPEPRAYERRPPLRWHLPSGTCP